MKRILHRFRSNHKNFWSKHKIRPLCFSLAFFVFSLFIEKIADDYVTRIKGIAVSDILLNWLPTWDIDFIIVQGALIITALALFLFLYKPKYLNFGLKTLSIFILVRSFFITLTHLGASPNQLVFDPNSFGFGLYNLLFNTSGDFFFSGHTGMPFLLALIFWHEKFWRYLFIAASVICGIGVLLAHIHYSIDVFAAPFITYTIYIFAQKVFHKDYHASKEI
jgi:hypothetical protein